jgi:hypothetical protein
MSKETGKKGRSKVDRHRGGGNEARQAEVRESGEALDREMRENRELKMLKRQ